VGWYGSNGYSVGSSLTWSDLYLYEMVVSIGSNIPDFGKHFPLIQAVYQTVGNTDKIKAYVASRPVHKI
jgi:hypothetical protein